VGLYVASKLQRLFPELRPSVDYLLGYDPVDGWWYIRWSAAGTPPNLTEVDQAIADVEILKEEKLSQLTFARNAALAALTATWDGDEWDANEETSNRISSILTQLREAQELGVVVPPQIPWRTADNQTRMLTIQELAAMGLALLQAQQLNIWSQNTALKDAVIAATTLEEVEAINWPQ